MCAYRPDHIGQPTWVSLHCTPAEVMCDVLFVQGNGAPDVFASLAAFGSGDGKIGLGAIIR
jgi:hypothetical protein